MIILVEQLTESRGTFNPGQPYRVAKFTGLTDAIKRGAKIVEAVGVRSSRTGYAEFNYATYRVDFPDELIPDLINDKFQCLVSLVPIPVEPIKTHIKFAALF